MRSNVRFALLAPLIGAILAVSVARGTRRQPVGIEKFVGVNCSEGHEACGEKVVGADIFGGESRKPWNQPKRSRNGRVSAGRGTRALRHHRLQGYPHYRSRQEYKEGKAIPTGVVTHVRVDVAPGLATSPAAVPQCTQAEFGETEAVPGTGFYLAPKCKTGTRTSTATGPESTVIGEEKATVFVQPSAEKSLTA